uniref:GH16 domain-containing protein n=2 Tax=Tetradesmus obliquus TaxID=3088 RepID=A0A383W1N3_TETOB|eukprot:jgi/Sobl393_1/20011/SZX71401.1
MQRATFVVLVLCLSCGMAVARPLSQDSLHTSQAKTAPAGKAAKAAAATQAKKAQQPINAEPVAPEQPKWPNMKPSDSCKPFDPTAYQHPNVDSLCAKLNSMSDEQLLIMHGEAPLPSATGGFPLRGCTHRCLLGNSAAALVARQAQNNMGWAGKCFNWDFNTTTGVPTGLINMFGPNYDNSSLPDSQRIPASRRANADVYYIPQSRSDGKPAWRFDHGGAEKIWDPIRQMWLIVNGFNDEMREVRPGLLMGRIFIKAGPDSVEEVPIMFALMQACTADGTFPTTPEARATPLLGHV